MRSVWIATGLVFTLLVSAALFRPGGQDLAASAPAETEAERVLPQPLDAADIEQLVALRAEIGGGSETVSGGGATAAAFQQELWQMAGLSADQPPPPVAGADNDVVVLRRAAETLDQLAARAEETEDYARADRFHRLGSQLWRTARTLAAPQGESSPDPPESAPLLD